STVMLTIGNIRRTIRQKGGCSWTGSAAVVMAHLSLYVCSLADETALDEGEGENDDKQQHSRRRRLSHARIGESAGVDQISNGQRGIRRTAVGNHEYLVEDLKRADQSDGDDEKRGRA